MCTMLVDVRNKEVEFSIIQLIYFRGILLLFYIQAYFFISVCGVELSCQ